MTSVPVAPGFYGKLPLLGDFVTRRLPRSFVAPWDQWLQSAISVSREQLGSNWLDFYLTSPIWRFALSPGLCGDTAWAGILMPSVDRVGRYFPLTLAAPVENRGVLPYLFDPACPWFEALERLALSGLDDGFVLDEFDARLQALALPEFLPADEAYGGRQARGEGRGKLAFHIGMDDLHGLGAAFMGLSASLLDKFLPLNSYWGTAGSDHIPASLLVCEGLPPLDGYSALMTGRWDQRGWVLSSRRVERPAESAPAPDPVSAAPRSLPAANGSQWRSDGLSVVGNRRKINEDALLLRPEAGLWVVADGMGGHHAGDVASQAIVDALAALPPAETIETYVSAVAASLQRVNGDLCRLARMQGEDRIIGSTVVVLLAQGRRCAFLWAGDSRLYRYRAGRLEQLTRDHSLYDELPDQMHCNVITRAIGADQELTLESGRFEAEPGDVFMLCSDGLDKELSQADIEAIFREDATQGIAQRLVRRAEERGARDNVTVAIAEYV